MLDFDKNIVNELVKQKSCFYRRYSDDIIIICTTEAVEEIKEYVYKLITDSKLIPSKEKTETFIFSHLPYNTKNEKRLTSIKINTDGTQSIGKPLIYLGFEFRGYNVCIKSQNLAKFYRRLIFIIKRRAKRANRAKNKTPFQHLAIYKNQIKKLYIKLLKKPDSDIQDTKTRKKKIFIFNPLKQEYRIITKDISKNKRQSNYISYIKRCEHIFNTQSFSKQIRKRKHIVNIAIRKYLNKNIS